MTCIAVKIKGKKIEIAGDTQVSWGRNKLPINNNTDQHINAAGKIFQVNGMTIGCAGNLSHIGLLAIYCKTHKPKEMVKDAIIDWFIEFKEWALMKAKINFTDISCQGIIINDKKAFCFYDFMDAVEVKTFDAVGSGMWLAIGAMELGGSVKDAVKVAIKYDLYCGGDITSFEL